MYGGSSLRAGRDSAGSDHRQCTPGLDEQAEANQPLLQPYQSPTSTTQVSIPTRHGFHLVMSRTSQPESSSQRYYFGLDPEVVFEIEGVMFGIPRSQLLKSELFRDMLESPHIGGSNEGTVENPIILDSITKVTLAQVISFHKVLSCRYVDGSDCAPMSAVAFQINIDNFATRRRHDTAPELSLEQWSDALRLATSWGFDSVRRFIIQNIDTLAQDPLARIRMADECGIKEWLHPAYARLCARKAPLTVEEGRILGLERYTALWRIREEDLKAIAERSQWEGPFARSPRAEKTGVSTGEPVIVKCKSKCCQTSFELNSKEKAFLAKISKATELDVGWS
ncbi:hypothetical protein FRB90_006650 [Tulasnella sp. 427]|nr:hypothetical protein FRB90_006650 [Tulasnella sp. 427]